MFKKKKQSGFIALTSVLLFGALILIMGLSMASSSISEQAMTGYEKGGEKAVSAANSCVDIGVSRVKSGEVSYTDIDQYNNINLYLYDDVYCSLSFEKDPDYSYRIKVTGTATTNTGQRSFSHTEYAYVDNHDFIPGLVGYWPMDEGRGHAVYNKASDDRESYLDFDGVDDYVNMGNDSSLDLSSVNRISISAWIKPTAGDWGNDGYVLSKTNPPAISTNEFIYIDDLGKNVNFTIGNTIITTNTSLTTERWYHIVTTFDGTNMSIYLDGVLNKTDTTDQTIGAFINPIIGARWDTQPATARYFNGQIDDVRIYNRALSEAEIQKLYNETENITDGLVGHWDMDETFGDLAVDSSGNNNHGTIYGAKRGGSKGKYVGIEAFTTVGSHTWTVPEGVTEVDVLVVGGGGGGSNYTGGAGGRGGAGAGGLIFKPSHLVNPGSSISINVGAGGAGALNSDPVNSPGNVGEDSIFETLTAIGGGGASGVDGGSGGGGYTQTSGDEEQLSNQGLGLQPSQEGDSGEYGYGNDGGGGRNGSSNVGRGGGGGGAGSPGDNGTVSGNGGDGLYYGHIFGDNYGENGWFAGGAGGNAHPSSLPDFPGAGGLGGGADGILNGNGNHGMDNTGGGGGSGGIDDPSYNGGDGGSGIVLIRYTKWVDGRHDKSLAFDGVSNYVDYDTSILNGASSGTISMWFNRGDWTESYTTLLTKSNGGDWNNNHIQISRSGTSDHINVTISDNDKSTQNNVETGDIAKNKWYNIVMAWNGVSLIGYLDGEEFGSYDTDIVIPSNSTRFSIGRGAVGTNRFFNGQIDDVRIYNRALTEDEIKFLYQRGLEYHVNR